MMIIIGGNVFNDREEAAYKLAKRLFKYSNQPNTLILALPRGGVVIGTVIAKQLSLPLDIIVTRKIGAPENPEFAIAAVSEDEVLYNPFYPVTDKKFMDKAIQEERVEIKRRQAIYRQGRPPLNLKNKTVILTDDGIATGLTMKAAIAQIKRQDTKKIVLAIPVAPPDATQVFKRIVDEAIFIITPPDFQAVGQYYRSFPQLSDQEVIDLLHQAK